MDRPVGTLTFLFSDIEGSTQRWERDSQAMSEALARHDVLMRDVIEAHGGVVFKVVGDAFYAVFATAQNALGAAVHAQQALAAQDFSSVGGLRVRIALHTGDSEERAGDYFGPTVNRVARLLAIGHGGQVLVSGTAADLLHENLPQQHGLRDLGLHGLKDLSRAERVFQATAPELDDAFPALRSMDQLPNNLPVQPTSFIGREEAVAEIKALVTRGPLVTLVGPGGVGKTRCALQSGAELLDGFPDGVWFVDLDPLGDPSLVTGSIAQTLGVREVPNVPLLETLTEDLARKQLLLILDNSEHVIDEMRRVAAAILRQCPRVRILATSREPLNITAEHVFRLPSLDAAESIALFADRARAVDARFELTQENADAVTAVASRLDGIPLAIELAAARVRVLSPAQIAQRLDERFRILTGGDRSALPRRQTLRATIDWSYDLLEDRERTLFRRLAIFAGSFSLEAVTAVCGLSGGLDEWDVLDSLTALVDKSLVLAESDGDDRRYRLLQSMREYGLERLREAGEEDRVAQRHVQYYAQFAASLAPLIATLEDEQWTQRCRPELDNFRAAIEWTLGRSHDPALGIALLAQLEWPQILTTPQEALRWYERAAAERDAMPDAIAHARILRHCVLLEWLAARPLAQRGETVERGVAVAKASNDPDEVARALASLGGWHRSAGRFDEAEAAFVEAYADSEHLSRLAANAVLRIWAVTDLQRGNVEVARQRFVEVVQSERPGSEAHASALLNLGELEYAVGNLDAAREAARHARETYTPIGSPYLVLVLANLGAYAMAADDLEDARKYLREAIKVQRRSARGWLCTVVEQHALLAALHLEHERAAILAGFAEAWYQARGEVRQYTERSGHERLVKLLAEAYRREELESLSNAGARLTDEEALEAAAAIYEVIQHPAEYAERSTVTNA